MQKMIFQGWWSFLMKIYIFLGRTEDGQHEFRMNDEENEARKCQHRREMVKVVSEDHRARDSRSQTRDFIFIFLAHLIYALLSPSLLPFSIYCCSFTEAKNKAMLCFGYFILFCFTLLYFYSILLYFTLLLFYFANRLC